MKWNLILSALVVVGALAQYFIVGPPSLIIFSLLALLGASVIWIFRLIYLLARGRRVSLGSLGVPLAIYAFLTLAGSHYQTGEIERAEAIGDTILERLLAFYQATGAFPDSLEELSEFDSAPIPLSGAGLLNLGRQGFHWMKPTGTLSFQGFGGNTYLSLGIGDWTSVEEQARRFANPEAVLGD